MIAELEDGAGDDSASTGWYVALLESLVKRMKFGRFLGVIKRGRIFLFGLIMLMNVLLLKVTVSRSVFVSRLPKFKGLSGSGILPDLKIFLP